MVILKVDLINKAPTKKLRLITRFIPQAVFLPKKQFFQNDKELMG